MHGIPFVNEETASPSVTFPNHTVTLELTSCIRTMTPPSSVLLFSCSHHRPAIPPPSFPRCKEQSTCVKGLPLGVDDSILAGECFKLTASDIALFPTMELKFGGGGRVAFPAERYHLRSSFKFCSGMQAGWTTVAIEAQEDDSSGTMIGDPCMMGNIVVRDRQRQRVGCHALAKDAACP